MVELPPASGRWRSSHKIAVLNLIHSGSVTSSEAIERFGLSVSELEEWQRHYALDPKCGLHASYVPSRRYRKTEQC